MDKHTVTFRKLKDGVLYNSSGIKNEANLTPSKFSAIFHNHITKFNLPADFYRYLRYHIDAAIIEDVGEINDILRHESSGTILDYYEILTSLVYVLFNIDSPNYNDLVCSGLKKLQRNIHDQRLSLFLFATDSDIYPLARPDKDIISSLNAFLRGNYKEAFDTALKSLLDHPENVDLIEVVARSNGFIPSNKKIQEMDNSILKSTLLKMTSIINMTDTIDEDIVDILKIASNNNPSYLSYSLYDFIKRETLCIPNIHIYKKHISNARPSFTPLHILSINNTEFLQNYLKQIKDILGESPYLKYINSIFADNFDESLLGELSSEENMLLNILILLNKGDYKEAYNIALKLELSPYTYYSNKAFSIISFCLLKMSDIGNCIKYVTAKYVRNQKLHYILPIKDIGENLDNYSTEQLKNDISLSIFYDMYSKYIDNKYDSYRGYAYEDFLFSNGIQRPSEITDIKSKFDIELVIYFLRHICIEPIMDCSTVYDGSIDITNERLNVCRILVSINDKNIETYQNEIKDILRRLMIQKRIREIEQSKIYVDIEGIKRSISKTMRESYIRYQSLIKQDTSGQRMEYGKAVTEKAIIGDIEGLISLPLPQNEMSDLLESMVIDLRNEYVSSSEHGLDGYLSVRIRHGTLSGQLRSPIEASKLITQRDSVTDKYKRNEHWINILKLEESEISDQLESYLSAFSKDFDTIVHSISNNWIQVKKDDTGKGLFDFTLTKIYIHSVISQKINDDTTFDEFLDIIFDEFGRTLDINLKNIREEFDKTGKKLVNDLFTLLQSRIDVINQVVDTREIDHAIRAARTEMQSTFDRIIEWFRLSNTKANEPFSLQEAVSISVESVRTQSKKFYANISTSENTPEVIFMGNMLTSFVDILFIIFENIVRHSKVSKAPEAYINISYENNSIKLTIENEVGESFNTEDALRKIANIKTAMKEGSYKKSISVEGGTGFHKIRKILVHDFRTFPKLPEYDFGFRENGRFYVEFNIYAERYAKEIEIEDINS